MTRSLRASRASVSPGFPPAERMDEAADSNPPALFPGVCSAGPRKKAGWGELCGALASALVGALSTVDQDTKDTDYRSRDVKRADVLPADRAVRIDEEGFRRAVDAPVDRGLAVIVGEDHQVRIAELLKPSQCVGVFVLPVEADHAQALGFREARKHRVLVATCRAPAAPHVEQERLAERFLQAVRHLCRIAEDSGELERALDYGLRAVAADPAAC